MISWRDTSQPAVEPVTIDLAKLHLKVDHAYEDALIGGYIIAARQLAEKITRRAFFERTVDLTLDHFPLDLSSTLKPGEWHPFLDVWDRYCIRLPKPRCVSVDSIVYKDAAGADQTVPSGNYVVDTASEPARIAPAAGCTWPYVANYTPGTIKVTYTAGSYGDGAGDNNTCPQTIVCAILLIVGDLYRNRASSSEIDIKQLPTVDALLDSEKFFVFGYE
jgi:hypothetical protein